MQLTPYLVFDGQCAEAFRFYERCLGGRIEGIQTYGDSPAAAHSPPEWHDRVLHVRLVADGAVLMGSDGRPGEPERHEGVQIALQVGDAETAERVFHALAEGGETTMPMQETFWSPRFGMLVDRFGVPWMVDAGPPA